MASGDDRSSSSSDHEDVDASLERFPIYPDIGFLTTTHRNRFIEITRQPVAPSRFISQLMMRTLGLEVAMCDICEGAGIEGIYNSRALTYTDITYEFPSSYYISGTKENPVAHYRIANYNVTTTVEQMADMLGVCGKGTLESPRPANRAILWLAMTGNPLPEKGNPHASEIQHLVLKIFGRAEPNNINNVELDMLDAYLNVDRGPRYQINIAAQIIHHLDRMARLNRTTPLYCGGIATMLTRSYLDDFNASDYVPLISDPAFHKDNCYLNLAYLRNSLSWLDKENNRYHDHEPILRLPNDDLPSLEPLDESDQPLPRPVYYIRAPAVARARRRWVPTTQSCASSRHAEAALLLRPVHHLKLVPLLLLPMTSLPTYYCHSSLRSTGLKTPTTYHTHLIQCFHRSTTFPPPTVSVLCGRISSSLCSL
ncbi:hypothetical protein RND81_08G069300 [Saponaria officinalis]|uniref:Uncharacterized protein n=1 Tax=Saponaria officinalis TaxID=3572 RepID=A0AAW1J4I2_SAPOF